MCALRSDQGNYVSNLPGVAALRPSGLILQNKNPSQLSGTLENWALQAIAHVPLSKAAGKHNTESNSILALSRSLENMSKASV